MKEKHEKTHRVNQVSNWIHTESITDANVLILVGANFVVELISRQKQVKMRIGARYYG